MESYVIHKNNLLLHFHEKKYLFVKNTEKNKLKKPKEKPNKGVKKLFIIDGSTTNDNMIIDKTLSFTILRDVNLTTIDLITNLSGTPLSYFVIGQFYIT